MSVELIGLTLGELNFHFTFRVHFKTSFPNLFSGFEGKSKAQLGGIGLVKLLPEVLYLLFIR